MGTVISSDRVRSTLHRDVAAIDTTVNSGAITSGDAVYLTPSDGAASLLGGASLTAAILANVAKFIGVAIDTYPIPYGDGITETVTAPGVAIYKEGEFAFATTASDSLAPGTPVTIGNGAQTVTVAPVPAAPTCALSTTAAASVNGLANAQHSVALAWVTALGSTAAGPATNGATTLTTGTDPSISVTVPTLPAWALACEIYVDGMLAEVATAAGAVVVSGYSTALKPAPTSNALAIGVVAQDQTSVGGSVGGTITGAAGQKVVVKIAPKA